ncbi:MAG: 4'-phosphopantetheinyl transferase family protein [Acidimicrobiales bacterium]
MKGNPHDGATRMLGIAESRHGTAMFDVRLWWTRLDVAASTLLGFWADLSTEERAHAGRLHRPKDRRRYGASRGALRRQIAGQLNCSPDEVSIVTGGTGKPRIAGSELRFNASRSSDIALFAFSWTRSIGVDIEAIRVIADVDGLAARFFSPADQRWLSSLPPQQRLVACFRCWTRWEAYLKGTGAGLGAPARHIDLSVTLGRPASGWSVHQVDLLPGFAAAVAVGDRGAALDGNARVGRYGTHAALFPEPSSRSRRSTSDGRRPAATTGGGSR